MSKLLDLWDELTGVVLDYALSNPPSSSWIMCFGQVLTAGNPATAKLRAKLIADGFPHGQDGSGNPKVPDARGRTTAGKDDMGGSAAGRLTSAVGGINGVQLGAAGGNQSHALTTAQMPTHNHGVSDPTHTHSVYDPGHAHGVYDPGHNHTYLSSNASDGGGGSQYQDTATLQNSSNTSVSATGISIYAAGTNVSIYAAGTGVSTQNNGSGNAHPITQPTLVLNKIIRL